MAQSNHISLITGKNEDGSQEIYDALAPVIISASRSTDIPAFYSDWLVKRLRAGWCTWQNPFNHETSYVSFEKARVFVFWSKNPAPLIPHLAEFDERGLGYYVQFTLNDYDREGFEPNVPSLGKRIETFKELSKRIGPERVIWRFDPIILGPVLKPRDILMKIWNISKELKGYTRKLVFSFVDIAAYRKVQLNMIERKFFTRANVHSAEATQAQIDELCEGLVKIRNHWLSQGWDLALATCAESVNLNKYGIEHNRCIDDVLLAKLFPYDTILMEYLGVKAKPKYKQGCLFQVESSSEPLVKDYKANPKLKDKGQRTECACIGAKDIGIYDTCPHFCAYCYANTSIEVVKRNIARHALEGKE